MYETVLAKSSYLAESFQLGCTGHQAMIKFEKRRQRDDESNDKFLDDIELLRRRSNPDENISEGSLAIASKFIDGVQSDELVTMLATHFTLSATPRHTRWSAHEVTQIFAHKTKGSKSLH